MPEKALKMQAWLITCRLIDHKFENAMFTKWLVAGCVAGAATTIVGKCALTL